MTIAFFSNFINHHQKSFSDSVFELTDGKYTFVATTKLPEKMIRNGYPDYSGIPYLLEVDDDRDNFNKALSIAEKADVALFDGFETIPYAVHRAKKSPNKLSFDVGERWLKKGLLNLLSPRLIKSQWHYHTLFYNRQFYKLCSGAFCAYDQHLMHSYRGRCYKWGYFPRISPFDINKCVSEKFGRPVRIMWCARYIGWKHPEMAIHLAKYLKNKNYDFILDMYGSGELRNKIEDMIKTDRLESIVKIRGNLPNDEILSEMRSHDILLMTSDRNEGWGAVVNEAMGNGCVVVGSDAVGSIPYLLKHNCSGLVFKSGDFDSFARQVEDLICNPDKCRLLARNAYDSVLNIWSPENAAKNLMHLIVSLTSGKPVDIDEGPCSKA